MLPGCGYNPGRLSKSNVVSLFTPCFLLAIDGDNIYFVGELELHSEFPFIKSQKLSSLIGVSPNVIVLSF